MLKTDSRLLFLMACLLGGVTAVAIYLPGLPGAFVFDDIGSIVENPTIRIHDLGIASLLQALFSSPGGGLLRPLSMLSFAFNAYFSGFSPFAFKLTNIFIHTGCAAMFGLVAREILIAYEDTMRRGLSRREIAWLSLAIALLWAVHPINLTAVLYTVQRETSLAAFFSALAVFVYLRGRRREREGRGGRWLLWVGVPLATTAGLLCKENAALVPVFLFLIEFTLLGFTGRDRKPSREVLTFFGLFLLLPGLALGGLILARPAALFGTYVGRDFDMYQRVLSESRILFDYLRWIAVPDPAQLGLYHDDLAISSGLLDPMTTLPACLGIIVLLAAAVWMRKRLPLLSLGLLWFFAGHLIESTVLPLELAFEHRNYVPLFGLSFGVLGTLYPLARDQGLARLAKVLAFVFIAIMAATTATRAADWHTELSFAKSESSHHPRSPRALSELELAYLSYIVSTRDTSLVPQAVQAAERSKSADGHGINQDVSLAFMFSKLGDSTNAKAYLAAAAEDAKSAHISSTLQFALQTLMDMAVPENQALVPGMTAVFENALANPLLTRDDCYTANMWNSLAIFHENAEEVPDALGAMHRAVALCPRNAQLRANFARVLLHYGDVKDAKEQLDALRALHDLRRLPELEELQGIYTREAAAPARTRPPG